MRSIEGGCSFTQLALDLDFAALARYSLLVQLDSEAVRGPEIQ